MVPWVPPAAGTATHHRTHHSRAAVVGGVHVGAVAERCFTQALDVAGGSGQEADKEGGGHLQQLVRHPDGVGRQRRCCVLLQQ